MEEIKVGEYIRTKKGYIGKIYKICTYKINRKDKTMYATDFVTIKSVLSINEIINHSKNIIDLIEVGDYVNGYICRYITDIDTGKEYLCNYDLNEMRWIPLKDIDIWESVVTKEQFASMEYGLED